MQTAQTPLRVCAIGYVGVSDAWYGGLAGWILESSTRASVGHS